MQTRLDKFLVVVQKELGKAEENHAQAKINASEVAASAAYSPSQSGDRFHSQGAADIAKKRVAALKKLKEEIESGTPRFIEKGGKGFFLVKNIALVPGVDLISVSSPVGKELMNHVE